MSKRITIARRELWALRVEKTIVLAIFIQLLIASFSSFLIVGLVTVYSPDAAGEGTQVEYGITGSAADDIAPLLDDADGTTYERYETFSDAYIAFQDGEVNAVLDLSERDTGQIEATLYAPETGIYSTVIVVRTRGLLSDLQEQKRVEFDDRLDYIPLSVEGEESSVPYFSFTYTVLVPILLFLPAFISGSITSDIITEGFKRGTIELLRAAPLTDVHVIDGKLLAMVALAPLQAAAWLALISLNGVTVQNIPALLVIVTGVTLLVAALGAAVALRYRDRSKAQFIYSAAIVGLFSLATLLPEHPVNTVARLSIGSATSMTYTLTGVYLMLGIAGVWLLRRYVSRVGLHSRT